MYGYEHVTPADMLDLHVKALICIQSGVVALPKFKTLKIIIGLGCSWKGRTCTAP